MTDLGTTRRPFLSLTKAYSLLTKAQTTSAVVFSTFAAIHGVQLLAANVGGASLANHWLIVGRPFYQDEHMEGILVTGSAVTHVLAGLAKLGIRLYWNRNKQLTAAIAPPNNENNVLRYHGLTGYLLIPLAGLHYYLVRGLPIDYYGDSAFIDFGYIAWGLQNKAIFSYGLHTALVVAASYHMVSGIKYVFQRKSRPVEAVDSAKVPLNGRSIAVDQKATKQKKGILIQKSIIAGLSVALVSSLVIIGRDTKKIPLRLDFAQMYARII
ncbi:conserved hypothetical protein [Mucor ambiguus]|uniref:Mitochondrial adapter protein MCP1 transmembrane domain-containing protein n=1 Tax=Mucor ambiguus TaxID=91626 RepID=A0A0C9M1A9_9FUNG|nr:conserved hypothetical protein [Mucor ambiguus]